MSDRRAQILALPEARGRRDLATHLADQTTMSVAEADAALSAAPLDLIEIGNDIAKSSVASSGRSTAKQDRRDAAVADAALVSAGYGISSRQQSRG